MLAMDVFSLIWLILLAMSLQPLIQQRYLLAQRAAAIRRLERARGSRVITLIHRQEGFSLLGLPFARFIDVDDSEEVLRAIELTDPSRPIDLILHTPGGMVLAAEQIARALLRHRAKVTVMVPHYAMSGGTLIALAADEILMAPSAVLGPVDPQVGQYPAASILAAVERKDPNELDDQTLILADVARKARQQVHDLVSELLTGNGMDEARAKELAGILSEGRWTHDYPISVEEARALGLPVSADLPLEVRHLMRLYPQPRGRRPSVEYVPMPYGPPERVPERERRQAS
jgi:ClpP class serine protease